MMIKNLSEVLYLFYEITFMINRREEGEIMVSLDTEVVNDLKSKVNIADLISQYVALSRTGKNYIGLCPFHGEKTPSFNVNAEKGFYHCFGCGRSGDAIEFLKEYNQVGFVDAVKELADFAGVTLNISDDREEKIIQMHHCLKSITRLLVYTIFY